MRSVVVDARRWRQRADEGGRSRASLARGSSYKYALRLRTGFIHRHTARTAACGALRACKGKRASDERSACVANRPARDSHLRLSLCLSVRVPPSCLYLCSLYLVCLSTSASGILSLSLSFPSRFLRQSESKVSRVSCRLVCASPGAPGKWPTDNGHARVTRVAFRTGRRACVPLESCFARDTRRECHRPGRRAATSSSRAMRRDPDRVATRRYHDHRCGDDNEKCGDNRPKFRPAVTGDLRGGSSATFPVLRRSRIAVISGRPCCYWRDEDSSRVFIEDVDCSRRFFLDSGFHVEEHQPLSRLLFTRAYKFRRVRARCKTS